MQWTVFVLSSAVLVTARTRSEGREEFGVGSFESPSIFHSKEGQLWDPRSQKTLYEILNNIDEKSESISCKGLKKTPSAEDGLNAQSRTICVQAKPETDVPCFPDVYGIEIRGTDCIKSDPKLLRKRALSALSRWKPLGNLGVRIKSIHRVPSRAPMMSMVPEMNLISAESSEGVRPLGQPLRWGRKR